MKREEILKMKAGRDMDALIAEKIIGLPLVELRNAKCPYCNGEMYYTNERSWCSNCNEWRYSSYKEYSDDIAAAWEVVDKMNENGYWAYLRKFSSYCACMFDSAKGIRNENAEAAIDEMPLAICRAVLLTIAED